MPFIENFRENLRRKVESGTEKKTEIAKRAGIHRVTLHKILAGEFEPSLDMCEKLANALGFSPPERIFRKSRSRKKDLLTV